MLWFIIGISIIAVLVFIAIIMTERFKQREQNDPELMARMEIWRKKWNPRIDFIFNLSMWALAFLIIYYVYLG